MSAKDTALQYHDAWKRHDYDSARALLDDDLSFKGPFDAFTRADDFIEAIKELGPVVKEIQDRKVFEAGDDVCIVYDMVTNGLGTQPIAEWYTVRGDKVSELRAFFDARPFAAGMSD